MPLPSPGVNRTGNGWYYFDVSALLQEWVDGAHEDHGMVFYGTSSPGGGSFQYFHSRENPSGRPILEVEYTPSGALEASTFGAVKALFRQGAPCPAAGRPFP